MKRKRLKKSNLFENNLDKKITMFPKCQVKGCVVIAHSLFKYGLEQYYYLCNMHKKSLGNLETQKKRIGRQLVFIDGVLQ